MSPSILEPGFCLGKYEVLAHIATGGMGSVYKAQDLDLHRIVALKVLPVRLAENELSLERFRREARLAARLSHKHIVTLFECGYDPDHDLHYLAMEFIDGIDLGQHIDRMGRLHPEEAAPHPDPGRQAPSTMPSSMASFTATSSRPISCLPRRASTFWSS